VHFDHHSGVVREATMSAAMQAYIAVRQGRLMERWLPRQRPVPVYVWNSDQDVCLSAFVLEHHKLVERSEGSPLLRWIVQYNNKIDVCGGLYPVNLDELVQNHFTWVFEPYRQQRMQGKTQGDEVLVRETIEEVCGRLLDLLEGRAGTAPITAKPDILYTSPYNFVIADEHGDPNSRLVLASQGHTNLISLICTRPNGRRTYSIIRGSPFDEDIFQIPELIDAFEAAEDSPGAKIWGGSNLAAGSDSEFGSSLHWTELRDIAEPIVRNACLSSVNGRPRPVRARKVLNFEYQIAAVFTAVHLPDGTYGSLLAMAREHTHPLPIVVCVREIDGGWVDLLEAGAFQVLPEPFDPEKVRKIRDTVLQSFRSLVVG
jgi:CheY-like chemotaxis protein